MLLSQIKAVLISALQCFEEDELLHHIIAFQDLFVGAYLELGQIGEGVMFKTPSFIVSLSAQLLEICYLVMGLVERRCVPEAACGGVPDFEW